MTNIAIQVENLSKAYQLGEIGTGTISHDFERWWAKMRGKEDPFLKIGQTNDRTTKAEKGEVVWSLKDINFEIEQGQAVGIIGRNGAGKSTLLKILSRVTSPTTGSVKLKGRVASLLEVGTGFHPELTGRENIYLNGAILGMRKAEIKRKFDEILDFAGVEKYIDTPVKRYSSGMYVRLAFAVAAHLESEILIVDEVLAVGDAEFQKKCLGKMNDVSKGEGRTVLFVSHNMQAVSTLTQNSIYLKNGKIISYGSTKKVISEYLDLENTLFSYYKKEINPEKDELVYLNALTSNSGYVHYSGEKLVFELYIHLKEAIEGGAVSLQIFNKDENPVIHTWIFNGEKKILNKSGSNKLKCILPNCRLYMGKYYCKVIIARRLGLEIIEEIDKICYFEVVMYEKEREYKWEENTCAYIEEFNWLNQDS
ncbi:MAG: ATP-binding cassette domain-containing protein [Sphingobacteriales bacterium]|nr:MAG: ATP-binding cassette domain-containing protein [Sphingobacteriales bacterium]